MLILVWFLINECKLYVKYGFCRVEVVIVWLLFVLLIELLLIYCIIEVISIILVISYLLLYFIGLVCSYCMLFKFSMIWDD